MDRMHIYRLGKGVFVLFCSLVVVSSFSQVILTPVFPRTVHMDKDKSIFNVEKPDHCQWTHTIDEE
jgi:hypothetical protein